MSEVNTGKCRCGAQVHWHKSSRTGRSYMCNSEDRRDFHDCKTKPAAPQQGSVTDRLQRLEAAVSNLRDQIAQIRRQGVKDADIPF